MPDGRAPTVRCVSRRMHNVSGMALTGPRILGAKRFTLVARLKQNVNDLLRLLQVSTDGQETTGALVSSSAYLTVAPTPPRRIFMKTFTPENPRLPVNRWFSVFVLGLARLADLQERA